MPAVRRDGALRPVIEGEKPDLSLLIFSLICNSIPLIIYKLFLFSVSICAQLEKIGSGAQRAGI